MERKHESGGEETRERETPEDGSDFHRISYGDARFSSGINNHPAYLNAASCSRVALLISLNCRNFLKLLNYREMAEENSRREIFARAIYLRAKIDEGSLITNEDRFLRKFLLRSKSERFL